MTSHTKILLLVRPALAAMLALCLLLPAVGAADPPPVVDDRPLQSLYEARVKEVSELQASVEELGQTVPSLLESSQTSFNRLQAEFRRINVMAQIARGAPQDVRTVVGELARLEGLVQAGNRGVQEAFKDVQQKAETLGRMADNLTIKTDLIDTSAEVNFEALRQSMKVSRDKLQGIARRLQKTVDDWGALKTAVKDRRKELEASLPALWRSYLTTSVSPLYELDSWANLPTRLLGWAEDLPQNIQRTLPPTPREWGTWALRFGLTTLLLLGVSLVFWRRSQLYRELAPRKQKTVRLAWLSTVVGLGLLGAYLGSPYRQSVAQFGLMQVLLYFGIMRLVWVLRNVTAETFNLRSPLRPLFGLFLVGVVLQALAPPPSVQALFWVVALVLALRSLSHRSGLSTLEKGLCGVSAPILVLLSLSALAGWPYLSILVGQGWCLLALALQFGVLSGSLMRYLLRGLPRGLWTPLVEGFGVGLGGPLVWLLSLAGVFIWLTLHFGGGVVLELLKGLEWSWGVLSVNTLRVVMLVAAFYVMRAIVFTWNRFLSEEDFRWRAIDRGTASMLQTVGTYGLWILFGLLVLNLLGLSLTSLAVVAGGLSVGIGFGMQNLVNNFVSGLILLFGRSLQPGDIIELDGLWCRVQRVNIRNTEVTTFDNAIILVPNSDLITGRLTNWSYRHDYRLRRTVNVGVAYGSDVAKVKRVLLEVAEGHPHVLKHPLPDVIFCDFGASSLDFALRFWLDHVDHYLTTPSELREMIDRRFREEGIEIAFPQMDLHLRSGDGQLRVVTGGEPPEGGEGPPPPA